MNNQDRTYRNMGADSGNHFDLDSLVSKLRSEDSRNLKQMRNMKYMYYALIVVYALLMIVNPDPDLQLHNRISGLCYVLGFTVFALIFRKYHIDYRGIDYSLSSVEMLSKAIKRYRFSFIYILYVFPGLVLIDAGITISQYFRWDSIEPLNRILIVQAVLIPTFVISGYIGYLIWRKRQKPLHDQARQLLADLAE
jgi:hypothetical protein